MTTSEIAVGLSSIQETSITVLIKGSRVYGLAGNSRERTCALIKSHLRSIARNIPRLQSADLSRVKNKTDPFETQIPRMEEEVYRISLYRPSDSSSRRVVGLRSAIVRSRVTISGSEERSSRRPARAEQVERVSSK